MGKYLEVIEVNGCIFRTYYEVEEVEHPKGIMVKIYRGKIRLGKKFFKNEKNETFESIEQSLLFKGAKKLKKGE